MTTSDVSADDQSARGLLYKGQFEAAILALRPHLARNPGDHAARSNLAVAHLALGDAPNAAREAGRAAAEGGQPNAHGLHAAALLRLGQATEALAAAKRALSLAPGLDEARFIAGSALLDLGRPEEAADLLRPMRDHPGAQLNLGVALTRLGAGREAERVLRRAAALDPASPAPLVNLAFLLASAHRLDEALSTYRDAIGRAPADARIHHDYGFACLLAGDYPTGWNELSWRTPEEAYSLAGLGLAGEEWNGEPIGGRRLLVAFVQGLGDAIQIARYLPGLAAQGAVITLACHQALHSLLARLPGVAAVVDSHGRAPPHDHWVAQFSLPRLAGTCLDTIPGGAGYLAADPALTEVWRARLPPGRKFGLVWAGNPSHQNDANRSLPVASLAPILTIEGIAAISLQRGHAAPDGSFDAAPYLTDLAEAAAAIVCLDLVVTADTAIAHLAGSLGIPVWLMLPHAPDWRWGLESQTTPWYDSATLLRQPRPGDWSSVVHAIAAGLSRT